MLHSNRDHFNTTFASDDMPPWVCAYCKKGVLALAGDVTAVDTAETLSGLSLGYGHSFSEDIQRFHCRLECAVCRETVFVVGVSQTVPEWEDEQGNARPQDGVYQLVTPTFFEPALRFISVPDDCPEAVAAAVASACKFYWSSPSIAASLLRKSLERMLDAEGIAVEKFDAKGKGNRLNLQQRIELFSQTPKCDVALLKALRLLGNVGAHDDELQHTHILDALEIVEHVLDVLYGKNPARIKALAEGLIERMQPSSRSR